MNENNTNINIQDNQLNKQRRIAIINDFACFGRCAITVALPILSAMGFECCPIPTALLSTNGAFQGCRMKDETSSMTEIFTHFHELDLTFDGILTGFFTSLEQIELTSEFIKAIKTPHTKVIVDPIMGDHGKLYSVTANDIGTAMNSLIQLADVITPNLTEAYELIQEPYNASPTPEELADLVEKLKLLGPKEIVITGRKEGSLLRNDIFDPHGTYSITTTQIGTERCGTGDVFSSVVTGNLIKGASLAESVEKAVNFLNEAITYTTNLGISPKQGVCFEPFLTTL